MCRDAGESRAATAAHGHDALNCRWHCSGVLRGDVEERPWRPGRLGLNDVEERPFRAASGTTIITGFSPRVRPAKNDHRP
jgi:hypothetical protein